MYAPYGRCGRGCGGSRGDVGKGGWRGMTVGKVDGSGAVGVVVDDGKISTLLFCVVLPI